MKYIPRDRDSSFEPQIIKKGQTRLQGFGDKIIAIYARGVSMRDIQLTYLKSMVQKFFLS
ncbi:MAG: transposase [Rickettsiales endosymbiont of Dermacentor nuttalli]